MKIIKLKNIIIKNIKNTSLNMLNNKVKKTETRIHEL